jgi:hypothetical protein
MALRINRPQLRLAGGFQPDRIRGQALAGKPRRRPEKNGRGTVDQLFQGEGALMPLRGGKVMPHPPIHRVVQEEVCKQRTHNAPTRR